MHVTAQSLHVFVRINIILHDDNIFKVGGIRPSGDISTNQYHRLGLSWVCSSHDCSYFSHNFSFFARLCSTVVASQRPKGQRDGISTRSGKVSIPTVAPTQTLHSISHNSGKRHKGYYLALGFRGIFLLGGTLTGSGAGYNSPASSSPMKTPAPMHTASAGREYSW